MSDIGDVVQGAPSILKIFFYACRKPEHETRRMESAPARPYGQLRRQTQGILHLRVPARADLCRQPKNVVGIEGAQGAVGKLA